MWSAVRTPSVDTWTLDRNWNRAEGERLLKAHQFHEAEPYLEEAVAEADRHSTSGAKRVRLRAQLADVQRKQGKFTEAEANLRRAIELAAGASDSGGYLLCLDRWRTCSSAKATSKPPKKFRKRAFALSLPCPTRIRCAWRGACTGWECHATGEDGPLTPSRRSRRAWSCMSRPMGPSTRKPARC